MNTQTKNGTPLWVALFTATSALVTLGLACATPFAALAAIAATRLSPRAGIALIGAAWAVGQAIGFCVLDYPRDPRTIAWGVAILTAALAGLVAARWGDRATAGVRPAVRYATAFGTGFVGYKVALLGWSFALGGVHAALSPYWTARQFALEGAILIALLGLYRLLTGLGVPMMAGRPAAGVR